MVTIRNTITKMLKRLRNWLINSRHFLFSWYTKDSQETQEPERSLVELPAEMRDRLVEAVDNLPNNPADQEAILSVLDETFDCWFKNPNDTNNSVVILSDPVATISRILSETLAEWIEKKQVPMRLLPLTARPIEIETIKSKLEYYLEQQCPKNNFDKQGLEVVVIPNLSWFFLRSLEGLEGIEYLQSLLCKGSENRFWIIGMGQVGWEYLNLIYNIEAYCGKVLILPKIESEELQEWLEPIINELDIIFDEPRLDQKLLNNNKDNKTNYFDLLVDISEGVSKVAVQGFLKSVKYEEIDEEEKVEEDETKSHPKKIVANTPSLQDLPALESADQYLLYSLLLQGDLTISELAKTLGDEELEVRARVQVLRRQGVVEQQGQVLKINPIYYPRLKQELANNNFVINGE